jgi:uncharacterized protein (TIRG00374 family)
VSPSRLVRHVLIATVLGLLVAAGLLAMASLPATLDALARFPWRLVPLVLLAVMANWALRFAKWHFYLGRLAIPLDAGSSLLVFLAGFTMAISPGKLGEVLKAVLVRDRVGTEVSRTASVVMAERLTDVAGLLALSALGATALPHGPALLGALAAMLAVAVVGFRSRALTGWVRRRAPARLRAARAMEPLRAFVHGGRALLEPGALAAAIALSVVSWFFECLAFALILRGLGAALPIGLATCVYAFASLAGAVSMLPGGLGVAEGSLTGLLAGVGTPLADAAAATLLVRLATLWLAVALGLGTLLLAFRGEPAASRAAVRS